MYERFIKTPTEALVNATKFPRAKIGALQSKNRDAAELQGVGRHSYEDMLLFAEDAMKALSDKIGERETCLAKQFNNVLQKIKDQ